MYSHLFSKPTYSFQSETKIFLDSFHIGAITFTSFHNDFSSSSIFFLSVSFLIRITSQLLRSERLVTTSGDGHNGTLCALMLSVDAIDAASASILHISLLASSS